MKIHPQIEIEGETKRILGKIIFLALAFIANINAVHAAATIHFVGAIDGGVLFTVQQDKITWQNVNFGGPIGVMTVNGVSWDTQRTNTLWNSGTNTFLTNAVDFTSAVLIRNQCRDAVVVQLSTNSAIIQISDTPNGSAVYDFDLLIDSVPTLTVTANIDGSDELHISPQGATWVHNYWSWPTSVSVNGIRWDPSTNQFLPNNGATAFLPQWVNIGSARIIAKTTRDLLQLEVTRDGAILYFADNPVGSGSNSVTLAFSNTATNLLSRPTLPATTQITLTHATGVSFQSLKDSLYSLEYTGDPASSNWISTGAFIIGDGGSMTLFDPAQGNTNRFYRVISSSSAD